MTTANKPELQLLWSLWGTDELVAEIADTGHVSADEVRAYVQGQPSRHGDAIQAAMSRVLPVSAKFFSGLTQAEIDQYKFLLLVKEHGVNCVRLRGEGGASGRKMISRALRSVIFRSRT